MSATAFQRARRLAAQKMGVEEETVPLGYCEAMEVLSQAEPSVVAPALPSSEAPMLSREERINQLKAGTWEILRDLLREYGLPINKPKNVSWDDFAIPQILKHEGF